MHAILAPLRGPDNQYGIVIRPGILTNQATDRFARGEPEYGLPCLERAWGVAGGDGGGSPEFDGFSAFPPSFPAPQ
jgi:hypothetical protein